MRTTSPEMPDQMKRAAIVANQADQYSSKDPESQPSDLREYFAIALRDLAKVLPENQWLPEHAERLATKNVNRMSMGDLDAIVLGMRSILEKKEAEITNDTQQKDEISESISA